MAGLHQSERSIRRELFISVADSFGKIVPADFLRRRRLILGVQTQLHPLIEGIFKPQWSSYALTIASMRVSRYSDTVHHNPDGSWWIVYRAKAGGTDLVVNRSMLKCIADREPVLAVQQFSDKSSTGGSKYRLLGLGLVESFDPATDAFRIRGLLFEFCLPTSYTTPTKRPLNGIEENVSAYSVEAKCCPSSSRGWQ
jgi:hypothetical protein